MVVLKLFQFVLVGQGAANEGRVVLILNWTSGRKKPSDSPQKSHKKPCISGSHKRTKQSLCIKVTKESGIFGCYTDFLKATQGVT